MSVAQNAMIEFVFKMVKNLGIDPEWIKNEIKTVGEIAYSIDHRLASIEIQNAEILRLMKGENNVEFPSPQQNGDHAAADGCANAGERGSGIVGQSGGNASEPRSTIGNGTGT
jgi:hypothetical protein